MDGGPGNGDELDGGLGDEKLETGGEGDGDIVIGNLGTDNLSGGPGNGDVVRGDGGIDTIDGGGGDQDIASFATSPKPGVVVSLAAGTATGDGHDTLHDIDDVVGSALQRHDRRRRGRQPDRRRARQRRPQRRRAAAAAPTRASAAPARTTARASAKSAPAATATPPQQETAVELNRGLDGVSLVVTGPRRRQPDHRLLQRRRLRRHRPDRGRDPRRVGLHRLRRAARAGRAGQALAHRTQRRRRHRRRSRSGPTRPRPAPRASGSASSSSTPAAATTRSASAAASPARSRCGSPAATATTRSAAGPGDDLLESGDEYSGTSGTDILNGEAGQRRVDRRPRRRPAQRRRRQRPAGLLGGALPGPPLRRRRRARHGLLRALETERHRSSMTLGRDRQRLRRLRGARHDPRHQRERSRAPRATTKWSATRSNNTLFGHGGADSFLGKGGSDSIEAIDGEKDKLIDCGPGGDQGAYGRRRGPGAEELLSGIPPPRPARPRTPPRRAAARTGRARSPRGSKRAALAAEDGEHVGVCRPRSGRPAARPRRAGRAGRAAAPGRRRGRRSRRRGRVGQAAAAVADDHLDVAGAELGERRAAPARRGPAAARSRSPRRASSASTAAE